MTTTERLLTARIAAHASWATTPDRAARTAPARAAYMKRFEDMVDPDRVLSEEERAIRAEHARKAHLMQMSLAAAKARRAKREASAKSRARKAAASEPAPDVSAA